MRWRQRKLYLREGFDINAYLALETAVLRKQRIVDAMTLPGRVRAAALNHAAEEMLEEGWRRVETPGQPLFANAVTGETLLTPPLKKQ
jgi:hypothetical protein